MVRSSLSLSYPYPYYLLIPHRTVAVIAGTLLPRLTSRDTRLLAHEGDEDENAEFARLRATVIEWRAEAAAKGCPLKLPFMPFFLRNIWTGAMLLFSLIMISTFFITKVWQAVVAVSMVGICWAVACWVPFAIIMEVSGFRNKSASHGALSYTCTVSSSSRSVNKTFKSKLPLDQLHVVPRIVGPCLPLVDALVPPIVNVNLCFADEGRSNTISFTLPIKVLSLAEQSWVYTT